MTRTSTTSSLHRPSRAFTLTELLIVMGVIAVLSVLTLVSVRMIIDDARLASATNAVVASLEGASELFVRIELGGGIVGDMFSYVCALRTSGFPLSDPDGVPVWAPALRIQIQQDSETR